MNNTQSKLIVKRAIAGMGLGLFASGEIQKGDFITEYTGELISSKEADTRSTKYLFEIDEKYTIDGSARENLARYINHFCNPNAVAEIEAGQIKLFALRKIAVDEEIGYDYGKEYTDEFIAPRGCKCPVCHKTPSK